jgi:uncharacterized membrane protein YvbJ
MDAPDVCPNCGAEVPRKARACPECGADETSGWSERAKAQHLGLPDDEFDYDRFVQEEFGSTSTRPTRERLKPRHIAWVWWLVAVLILLAIAYSFLRGSLSVL